MSEEAPPTVMTQEAVEQQNLRERLKELGFWAFRDLDANSRFYSRNPAVTTRGSAGNADGERPDLLFMINRWDGRNEDHRKRIPFI